VRPRLLLVPLLLLGCATAPEEREVAVGRYVMGTLLEIVLHAPASDAEDVAEELVALARGLEAELSRWAPDSALSRLNASSGVGAREVPPGLLQIVADSVELSRATRGSFDVSVGPLVALWTRAAHLDRPPSPAELSEARRRVGSERIGVTLDARTVELAPGMSLDLGGVAKGFALDRMRERLLAREVERALVSFGHSSILALGAPPGEPGWRILLQDGAGAYAGQLTLSDAMLSVSGSFGRASRIGGRDYGHVIDPRTGVPLTEGRQAAVLAPTGAAAEAYSKALLVLEPSEAQSLLESLPGTEGLLLREGAEPLATSGWERAVRYEPLAIRTETSRPPDRSG
jgi:thiamine biosynthesis lipoprotein